MSDSRDSQGREPLSRRSFLKGATGVAGGAATGSVLTESALADPNSGRAVYTGEEAVVSGTVEVTLDINGEQQKVNVEPRTTLLSTLRSKLDEPLTGTKEVCDQGNCGACTVIVDGSPVYSCMQLAVECVGKEVRTVEGLGSPEALSPVQAAFCQHDALMCGFCTPGFVVSSTALLERNPSPTEGEIRAGLSGNLCRCGTYPYIFDAVNTAARGGSKGGEQMKRGASDRDGGKR